MTKFDDSWSYPPDHPIPEEKAKELIAGDLGRVHLETLRDSMAPLCWSDPQRANALHSGTLTFAQTPSRVIGVTAAHVLLQYFRDREQTGELLRVMNAFISPRVIDVSEEMDLAAIEVTAELMANLGVARAPISLNPRHRPQEGRGIILAGYPARSREETRAGVGFGMFTAIGVARRVTDKQITWVPDRERHLSIHGLDELPQNSDLGGISGGPLLAWYEKGLLAYCTLSGIVVEANTLTECVVAVRADAIRDDGGIRRL